MSFYTSLTGLNAATAQLGVTSNNIANVSTTGFKRSRSDFGDIFATSPLQKASSTIGQGVSLKRVVQEFGQGNMVFSSNTLDLAISGDGFFPLKSQDGFQDIFTRNGVFMMNDQYNVVNSAGQKLMAASVDSSGKANLNDMNVLTIPQKTTGMAKQTSKVQLGLNFPADAVLPSDAFPNKTFNRNDPDTYNKSTALTVYDAGGNSYLASVYYVKTQNASQTSPYNKWQTYVYVGNELVSASLQQATNSAGELMYVNKYGELKATSDFKTDAEKAELASSFSKKTQKFSLDDLTDVRTSQPAAVSGTQNSAVNLGTGTNDGVDFSNYSKLSKSDLLTKQGSSSIRYTLNSAMTAGDSYKLTLGGSTEVQVLTTGTTPPTAADVAHTLNYNKDFAAKYVAQNTTMVTISGPSFASGAGASTTDFSSFSYTIDNRKYTINNLNPSSADLPALASELQDKMRSLDGGSSSISVTVAANGKDIEIEDSKGRSFYFANGDGLTLKENVLTGAKNGGTPVVADPMLRITAIDPSSSAHKIAADLALSETISGQTTEMTSVGEQSRYPRSTFNYAMAINSSPYSVTFGPSGDKKTIDGASLQELVNNLKADDKFKASYSVALSPDSVLSITSVDPSVLLSSDLLTVSQTDAVTGLQDITGEAQTAAVYDFSAATAPLSVVLNDANGAALNPPVEVLGNTVRELVDGLNADATFSANYDAFLVNGKLKIMALNPTVTGTDLDTKYLTVTAGGTVGVDDMAVAGVATDSSLNGKNSIDDLRDLFSVNIDGSASSVSVGLDRLAGKKLKLSGAQIAAELTNAINRAYGDEKPFNFSTTTGTTFTLQLNPTNGGIAPPPLNVDLSTAGDAKYNMRQEDLVAAVQAQIDLSPSYRGQLTVDYDTNLQQLVFKPTSSTNKLTITSTQSVIGLTSPLSQGVNDDSVGLTMKPAISASPFRQMTEQRYGAKVEYDAVNFSFVFKSGSTGDNSSISIANIRPNSLATASSKGLGLTQDETYYVQEKSTVVAQRGISSEPAKLTGKTMGVNVDNNFSVDETNNKFVVSVNGVTGTVVVPPKDSYTLDTFMEALQSGINSLQSKSSDGLTPQTVDGVKVSYSSTKNALVFTTGTASTNSYIKISGDTRWGLDGLDAAFGTTTTWIKPKVFTENGQPVYIDEFGKETTSPSGFDTLPAWSPVYFDKGELTFDTAGNLVSPKQGSQLDTVYLPNGKGALTINIDYSKSTQFASPFAVLSQSQDGAPEGDLVGLAIKEDGLVSASYSNGAQKSLAKVVLVNFSNPSGLRQIGDTNYYKTSESGTPKYGEAGSAGFGTLRSGATERANVDLTQELVDLITEQRNFQANAKAMETSTSMTQTIIQIRN